jgi:hypothetical protein
MAVAGLLAHPEAAGRGRRSMGDVEHVAGRIEETPGRYFFHYTTREGFEHILPCKRLRFSPYERMRDPLENKRWRFNDDTGREPTPTAAAEFRRLADTIRTSAKLLSLTVDAPAARGRSDWFNLGWARPRMWEQYAENHAGVCLVFDQERLTRCIKDSLQAQGLALPYHHPICYQPAGTGSGVTLDLRKLAGEVTDDFVARYVEDHHLELFFLKAADCATEFEYRFVVTTPDFEYVRVDYGNALAAVIAGEELPNWQRPAAVHSCTRASVDPLVVDWSTGRPLLVSLPRALGE